MRILRAVADAIARRRNAVARHELFREHLAALELRCGARRTEDRPARSTNRSTMPRSSGSSGPTIVRSMRSRSASVEHCSGSAGSTATVVATAACPRFRARRQRRRLQVLRRASRRARARGHRRRRPEPHRLGKTLSEKTSDQVFTRLGRNCIPLAPELYCPERQAHL